ncbi:altered inheritance of mitochondria protein 21 [Xylariaceae sp. FL1019]|nr:altered inheritance of mitochondria protein 21 [Xylariaceae sp. FL1019]
MPAATMQSTPAVPPRPTRSQDKADDNAMPAIPPRPTKRFNRSVSPNPDRFAPSPLNESPFNPKAKRLSQSFLGEELERSTSVDLPGVGQEGQEYAAAIEGLGSPAEDDRGAPPSPEQTRSVGEDVQLHAPKPTVPAISAKQRVAAVTRTDSDRAATFGIGIARPSSEEPIYSGRSLKKKASNLSQLSHQSEQDEPHGIPEIGQRVPMLAYAGDVQAPSPAPPRAPSVDSTKSGRHHNRRSSSRTGFNELPPGSYGLHGHGVESTDKLEKAYYQKHPEKYHKEHYNHLHDRNHDYSMSSENLNKIVRDTASRGAGSGTSGYIGTPSEHVGYQASDEYTSRISSPQPTGSSQKAETAKSPLASARDDKGNVIHIDDHGDHTGFAKFGDEYSAEGHGEQHEYEHPILAADEVAKDPNFHDLKPAVPAHHHRRQSAEETRSRPSSRPASLYSPTPADMTSTPLDDVEEYEPLFPEGEGEKPKTAADKLKEYRQRFPSRDIWEDAPNSVHSTAEVSTPEPTDSRRTSVDLPPRDTETPAQAFARRQEELAEKEATNPDAFLNRTQRPKSWAEHQPHLAKEIHSRTPNSQRFPSRDIWEDTPDSLQFTTTVSRPQSSAEDTPVDEEEKPKFGDANFRGSQPMIPARPKKQSSGDDKPTLPGRPKPQVPARPGKSSSESSEPDAPRQKPAVPARPSGGIGGKIAALQAGFMSDLNNRLRIGPQAPKKEASVEEAPEEKERAPLADARKGRARGPQRRAPTKASSPGSGDRNAPPPVTNGGLTFSMTRTLFSINEEGTMTVDDFGEKKEGLSEKVEEITPEETEVKPEVHEVEPEPEVKSEKPEVEEEATKEEKPTVDEPSEKQTGEDLETEPETKTLATNTAGEPVVSEIFDRGEGDVVKDVEEVIS